MNSAGHGIITCDFLVPVSLKEVWLFLTTEEKEKNRITLLFASFPKLNPERLKTLEKSLLSKWCC